MNNPKTLWLRVQSLKHKLHEAEAIALRSALEQGQWLELRAAAILDIPRGTLQRLLSGRHKALGEEARGKRNEIGYKIKKYGPDR